VTTIGTDGDRPATAGDDRYDARGRRVIFAAHCLLNENVRYPGGATRSGTVDEFVDAVQRSGVGIVQMVCPEQQAWGGVLKRRMLMCLGADRGPLRSIRKLVMPLFVAYTRWRYDRLASRVAAEVADYRRAGFDVVGIVGVDGSPSCGVRRTLDVARAADALARCDPTATDATAFNERVVRASIIPGYGLFTAALRRRLRRRRLGVAWFGHDLMAELDGRRRLPPDLDQALSA
jgi:predicted secreted protein